MRWRDTTLTATEALGWKQTHAHRAQARTRSFRRWQRAPTRMTGILTVLPFPAVRRGRLCTVRLVVVRATWNRRGPLRVAAARRRTRRAWPDAMFVVVSARSPVAEPSRLRAESGEPERRWTGDNFYYSEGSAETTLPTSARSMTASAETGLRSRVVRRRAPWRSTVQTVVRRTSLPETPVAKSGC